MRKLSRRSTLKWFSRLLAATNVLAISVPLFAYLARPLRRDRSRKASFQRVARLSDLGVGQPILAAILGDRRDAWTAHPREPIGRVWLLRGPTDPENPAKTTISALSARCPHLGCMIQLGPDSKRYICPCHGAAFAINGQRIVGGTSAERNHAPRGMDALECRIVADERNEWWVEVKYKTFDGVSPANAPA